MGVTGIRVGQASTTSSKAKLLIYKPKFLGLTVKLPDPIVRTADCRQKIQTPSSALAKGQSPARDRGCGVEML